MAKYEGFFTGLYCLLTILSKLINYTEFEENQFEVAISRAQIKRIKMCSRDQDPGPFVLMEMLTGQLFFNGMQLIILLPTHYLSWLIKSKSTQKTFLVFIAFDYV